MWRHKIRKFAVKIFQNVNNRPPSLCQILLVVAIEIVINSALHYIFCRYCIAFKVMLLISTFVLLVSVPFRLDMEFPPGTENDQQGCAHFPSGS